MPPETDLDQGSLQKLTVPQLKVLCKEHKIAGYSKLAKAALIDKLSATRIGAHQEVSKPTNGEPKIVVEKKTVNKPCSTSAGLSTSSISGGTATASAHTTHAHVRDGLPKLAEKVHADDGSNTLDSLVSQVHRASNEETFSSRAHPVPSLPPAHIGETNFHPAGCTTDLGANVTSPRNARTTGSTSKKRATESSVTGVAKKRKVQEETLLAAKTTGLSSKSVCPTSISKTTENVPLPSLGPVESRSKHTSPAQRISIVPFKELSASNSRAPVLHVYPDVTLHSPMSSRPAVSGVVVTTKPSEKNSPGMTRGHTSANAKSVPLTEVRPVGKRFQKLVVNRRPQALPLTKNAHISASRGPSAALQHTNPPVFYHLDFLLAAPIPQLTSINLPPSLAQRKRVQHWAIILSELSNAERRQCVLVSRMVRYAVYLSAFHLLKQRHAGRRISQDIAQYSQAMTNMWPYLRVREAEAAQRRHVYEVTFLARFIRSRGLPQPIADRLWSSPDDGMQINVALRFVLSRLWFALSIGSGANDSKAFAWLEAVVVDTQPVIPQELWSVTVEGISGRSRQTETFFVLEATCEPVGCPDAAIHEREDHVNTLPVRVDWSGYINHHLHPTHGTASIKLLDQLKWANREEYERGISRLWLKRIQNEGELGVAKRVVAEPYALACVVANSISGQWMSASEMAQDFAGLSSRTHAAGARPKATQVNLYLPEHHHVESVHFTTARGQPLHAGLAVVQTPHRAYFILRDNGMQVGCEEDGVSEVWQEVIGCDTSGR
ncbi:hypothetical protein DAEQUDRAFT_601748 [Daedalea quercina L-15889]|uniref:Rho termination factor N-terminal domain-containing protein n=1 Tax=Daedalea quercina L-15889 TaxID=1314783 RepID=A0A165LMW0_9APHY|nr:hypothetical protein DAEQUDRAFT_601748 [Daedalea quercina L-15889]